MKPGVASSPSGHEHITRFFSDPHHFKTGRASSALPPPHTHLARVFGNDWFALKAGAFARFFGAPFSLMAPTLPVAQQVDQLMELMRLTK